MFDVYPPSRQPTNPNGIIVVGVVVVVVAAVSVAVIVFVVFVVVVAVVVAVVTELMDRMPSPKSLLYFCFSSEFCCR